MYQTSLAVLIGNSPQRFTKQYRRVDHACFQLPFVICDTKCIEIRILAKQTVYHSMSTCHGRRCAGCEKAGCGEKPDYPVRSGESGYVIPAPTMFSGWLPPPFGLTLASPPYVA